jgi:hypothetical protein
MKLVTWDTQINNKWKFSWSRLTGYGYLFAYNKFIGFIRNNNDNVSFDFWGDFLNNIPKYVEVSIVKDLKKKANRNYEFN